MVRHYNPPLVLRKMRKYCNIRQGWIAQTAILLAVVIAPVLKARPLAQEPLTVEKVIDRASEYVETFVEELSTVVMQEDYRQTYRPGGRSSPEDIRLVSEFLLLRVEELDEWVGFRDVFKVNGRQIRDREDRLAALFLSDASTALTQARRIAQESSRYNLGSTYRTLNIPTYVLLYLHPDNISRFRYRKDNEGCASEDTAWNIHFEEIDYPTLARGFEGISLPSEGRFCLDPLSGRVVETELELHHPPAAGGRPATNARVRVTFAFEQEMNLWVPREMHETYSERGGGRTSSTARYNNYKRFSIIVSENADVPGDRNEPE